jgi:hypothetical protein
MFLAFKGKKCIEKGNTLSLYLQGTFKENKLHIISYIYCNFLHKLKNEKHFTKKKEYRNISESVHILESCAKVYNF